jgi:peptide/nickel transport system permease protein
MTKQFHMPTFECKHNLRGGNTRRNIQLEEEEKILRPSVLILRSFRRDKAAVVGCLMILVLLSVGLLCPLLAPYDPLSMRVEDQLKPPTKKYWLGTDRFGRDQLSRMMYGARTSMLISFGSVALSVVVGVIIGLISGYYGGKLDGIIMRVNDVFLAFPVILLALAIVAIFGPNFFNLLMAIGFIFATSIARVARGSVLSVKEKEYIEGVRSVGARNASIMFYFILPNILAPIIVQATFFLSTAITIEAALSFLGLGTQPPIPSWGLMLNESRRFMEAAPWLTIFPGVAIVFAVLAFNLVGDGLRNALDPHLSQR